MYSQQELKEKLYQEIISFFDRGKVSVSPCSCSRSALGGPLCFVFSVSVLVSSWLSGCGWLGLVQRLKADVVPHQAWVFGRDPSAGLSRACVCPGIFDS